MKSQIRQVVKKSGKTFYWGIGTLPKAKREAMYTIYAFFMHIHDIVQSSEKDLSMDKKKELLEAWREEFDFIYDKKTPTTYLGQKIYKNCMRFKIPKSEFIRFLKCTNLEIDKSKLPIDTKTLLEYCRGTSGTYHYIALKILGYDKNKIEDFSTTLGIAVELTNILRDIKDVATAGQMFLPREALERAEIYETDAMKIVTHTKLYQVRKELALIAIKNYEKSFDVISNIKNKEFNILKIALNITRKQFNIMNKRGWEIISPKPKINPIYKLYLIINGYLGKVIK